VTVPTLEPPGRFRARWQRLRRAGILVLGAVVIGLFPWTLYLTYTLPARHVTPHWDIAWAGFDVFEAVSAAGTVIALLRNSRHLVVLASTTATILVCDAWFDVVTSRSDELLWSGIEAIVAEIPLAVFCFWIAVNAEWICAQTQGFLSTRRSRRRAA